MGSTVKRIILGGRTSQLAQAQTDAAATALSVRNGDLEIEQLGIATVGDLSRDRAISQIGVGVFVKQIEAALIRGEIDVAVHSLKDVPTIETDGLAIAGVPYREDPRDVLVSRHSGGIPELPQGSIVATGSARRRAMLHDMRKDLILKPVRGNVPTRLRMVEEPDSDVDAVLLAAAGLKRIGMADKVSEYLGCMEFVAAPGQGALALQTRADDIDTIRACESIQHADTRLCVDVERAFMRAIKGGCTAPIGAHAQVDGDTITLATMVANPSGSTVLRRTASAPATDGVELAKNVADWMLNAGARDLLPKPTSVIGA